MKSVQMQKDIFVDGEKYIVQLYGPTFGLTLYAKLLRLLGTPAVKLFGMLPKGVNVKSVADIDLDSLDMDVIGEALQTLFLNLRDDEFAPLLKEILSETRFPTLDPVASRFESEFAGQYLHLFKLVGKTLGVQYADFLSGLVKRASAASAAAASPKLTTAKKMDAVTS